MAIYRFGRCELDNSRHRLLVAGIERHVEPGVFDLLQFLVEKGDAVATRDALIERVWKGRIVSDSSISVRINAARKVVGDTGSRQAVIKTVPRRGFRLAVEVTRVDDIAALTGQPDANIDWLEVAYPTRCYEESECKQRFLEGLGIAGL